MTTLRTGPLGQRVCWALSAAFVATLAACGGGGDSGVRESPKALVYPDAGVLSSPTSAAGIVPRILDGANNGGNITCAEVGMAFYGDANYYPYSTTKVDYAGGGTANDTGTPWLKVMVTEGRYVEWTVDGTIDDPFSTDRGPSMIGAAIVKGSNEANVYVYDPQRQSDSGLASPVNASNNNAGLSNITFCWKPQPLPGGGQWCSPGYWRQPQHFGAWLATGIATTDLYTTKIGALPAPISRKPAGCSLAQAPMDPTLLQVLQKPQCYGGEAFNAVGDLLSAAHPDVNFLDERVPDSCPLGYDPLK